MHATAPGSLRGASAQGEHSQPVRCCCTSLLFLLAQAPKYVLATAGQRRSRLCHSGQDLAGLSGDRSMGQNARATPPPTRQSTRRRVMDVMGDVRRARGDLRKVLRCAPAGQHLPPATTTSLHPCTMSEEIKVDRVAFTRRAKQLLARFKVRRRCSVPEKDVC